MTVYESLLYLGTRSPSLVEKGLGVRSNVEDPALAGAALDSVSIHL